jgi:NADPH:quinone reductase-like Zn-dependent oxidoreductase
MKAVIHTEYGSPDVLHVREIAQPTPKSDEVLVRVRATSVNYGDTIARRFGKVSAREFNMPGPIWLLARLAFGWNKPKKGILGSEFAGEIVSVGASVTRFKEGDKVFGYRGQDQGANVEYLTMKADGFIAYLPANMSLEEAATVSYGALTALSLLKKANLQRGQKVLINGASGAIGTAAVQIAKALGAEVTGTCSTPRMATVKAFGADKVIDYTREDYTQGADTYDLIFDVLGRSSFGRAQGVLNANGRMVYVSFKMKQVFQALWTSRVGNKRVLCLLSDNKPQDMETVRDMIEAGQIKAIIDRCYPLEQAADAHRYAEAPSRTGSVVLLHT